MNVHLINHLKLGEYFTKCNEKMYKNSVTKIKINDMFTEDIAIKSGIKQGCPKTLRIWNSSLSNLMVKKPL